MDRGEICDKFLDAVTFDLYPFQEEALLAWFEVEGGLLVCAPTGMGKTLIAEAALFEALHSGRRLYYTTPLIALTDQKFREFQGKAQEWGFPRDEVGLITGNRRVNPDARIRVVVAEILLNHLLTGGEMLADVSSVVMDEFHNFNDFERGIVWELSLVLLPPSVRLMLLSATVGNTIEFAAWLREEHGRRLQVVRSNERRVPLEFIWVSDRLLTEHLPAMVAEDDAENRSPALVFCFNRDECWEVAERLKGLKLIAQSTRARIEQIINPQDFTEGIGPKLRQMLIRGVGVHHAGILPKYKEVVEKLFLEKLIPLVVCTETLAAGINLPARSVVLSTLLKGKPGDRKLVPSSAAHQMFGRAGRPQFDKQGYVYALAHEDDIKIEKWRKRYEQIDPNSKDPGIMRARKQLERKRPKRRKTEQYWSEGQFKNLITAGPAKLASRSMIPYQVLIYLLTRSGSLKEAREFLSKRFNRPERLEKFQDQLDHMIDNLAAFGYLTKGEDGEHVTLDERIHELSDLRSVDPLYGAFLAGQLVRASLEEKIQALESVLPLPPAIGRAVRLPEDLTPGPLQTGIIEPLLIQMGILPAAVKSAEEDHEDDPQAAGFSPRESTRSDLAGPRIPSRSDGGREKGFSHQRGGGRRRGETIADFWADGEDEDGEPENLSEMLKALFDAKLATPEDILVQPKWIIGGIIEAGADFYKYVRSRNLLKNEGLIMRHLLRLVILAGEFAARSDDDPDYGRIVELSTRVCQQIDPSYTDRFLAAEEEAKKISRL